MHPLDGSRHKINRAIGEIDRIRSIQDTFFQNTHYSIVRAEYNPESGKYVYRVKIDGPLPLLDWGVYIGEITHNLRSALNYLVYQLALLNSLNKPETVAGDKVLQFPIFIDEREFERKGQRMIRLLRPEHKVRIKRLQPYSRSGGVRLNTIDLTKRTGSDSHLFWLEEINNADKHRIIQVVGVRPGSFGTIHWGGHDTFTGGTFDILEDGVKFGEAAPDVNVKVNIAPLIAFTNCLDVVDREPVYFLLKIVATTISEIIESFATEFR